MENSGKSEKIKYDDFVVINNKKLKKYFRLNAPRKGFGRKRGKSDKLYSKYR